MARNTRPISWIKAARKDFDTFPESAQLEIERALTVAAEGGKADIAKPMKGLGSGVFEIALAYRGDAYRADLWVIHAFQKKSKKGRETPQSEIDLIRERIKRLKEALQ